MILSVAWWLAQFGIGLAVGLLFPELDRRISTYLMEKEQIRPVHRSFIFLLAIMIMAIFQITSSQSPAGFGALFGIQVAILWRMQKVWGSVDALRQEFFWDLAKSTPYQSLWWFCVLFAVVTIIVFIRAALLLLIG